MLCTDCWQEKEIEDFALDFYRDDVCRTCVEEYTRPTFADEVGASFGQIKWAVSELNARSRRIAELEAENAELKSRLVSPTSK